MSLAFGLDLGGTKLEIIALDAGGLELLRRRRPTPRGDYDQTLDAIHDLVAAAEAELGQRGSVGLCHPGTLSPVTGLLKNANLTWLNGRAFGRDVVARMGRPVAFANDANCLALSEAVDGAGAGARTVFAVIIGTGVGGGLVVDGRLITGADGITGEWGHIGLGWPRPEEVPGPACFCGLAGCVETWLSGPAFAADHARRTGTKLAAPEIVARVAADPECARSLEIYIDRLTRGLATLVNILDPDVIVLGGGMSNVEHLYDAVPQGLLHWLFSDRVAVQVRRAVHGDSSGVRGAAWLGRDLARQG